MQNIFCESPTNQRINRGHLLAPLGGCSFAWSLISTQRMQFYWRLARKRCIRDINDAGSSSQLNFMEGHKPSQGYAVQTALVIYESMEPISKVAAKAPNKPEGQGNGGKGMNGLVRKVI